MKIFLAKAWLTFVSLIMLAVLGWFFFEFIKSIINEPLIRIFVLAVVGIVTFFYITMWAAETLNIKPKQDLL